MDTSGSRAGGGGVLFLYRELWKQSRGHRHRLAAACALLIGAQVILLGVPYVAAKAINSLQVHGIAGARDAGVWLGAVLLITACSWLLHGPGRILERHVSLLVRQRVSTSLIERLLVLPLSWHEAHHSGATAHRVQQSSQALSNFAQCQFIYLNSAVRLIGPVVALWWIEPFVGMAAIGGFALISASVVGFDRAMIRLARRENDAERRYASALVDVLGNATTLFALRQARGVLALVDRRLQSVFEPQKKSILLNEAKWCTVDIATRALSCALVALFAWRASRLAPSGGEAVPALMLGTVYMVWEYALQSGGVIASVAQHFQTFARQYADYTSADEVRDATVSHLADPLSPADAGTWQRLELHDVSFRHGAGRTQGPVLDRISLTLERGKRYALVGASGSGKSTLLRLLAGLYACDRGVLRADGGPVRIFPHESARFLRATSTLIPQDAEVFAGSLAENLGLCESVAGPPDARDFPVALQLARTGDFVRSDEEGLGCEIAERAANWSGGQRSRIALARGILASRGSSLILLDEPTAHLDPETEAQVYANLFETFRDACIVSSVHRLNVLDRFDEVLVMHAGRLVAQGPLHVVAMSSPELAMLMNAHGRERPTQPEVQVAVA